MYFGATSVLINGSIVTFLHFNKEEPVDETDIDEAISRVWPIICLILIGLIDFMIHLFETRSYQIAKSSFVSMLSLIGIVYALFSDHFILGTDHFSLHEIAGAAVIIASNTFVMYKKIKVERE